MKWYYVLDNQQKGPVEPSELQRLLQSGAITNTALVWQEGMTDWQPYNEVPAAQPLSAAAGVSGQGGVVCVECGRAFGLNDVVRLPNGYVCAACKPIAMQKLSEGITETSAEQIRREHIKHEASVKSVGFLYFLAAAFLILIGGLGVVSPGSGGVLAVVFVVIGAVQIWVGVGLRKLKPWARTPTGILSGLGLILFPIGTLINAYVLYLVFSNKGRMVFSEEYQQVIEQTPHIKYKTSVLVWIVLIVLVALLVFGLAAALVAGRK